MDKALATQLTNIEKRTGRTLDELARIVKDSGLTKHGEVRDMLKRALGMGHGDANALIHYVFQSVRAFAPAAQGGIDAEVDRIYSGPKAALRPIHDKVMAAIEPFGPFDIAPKKTYLSLRRRKQFAMVGPATNTRVEVGLNMKGVAGTSRLEALAPGGMCQYKVRLTGPAEVDKELVAWIRRAYDEST
jgi:hypothetical protein